MSVLEEAREWIAKAECDYQAAVALSRRRKHPLPEIVCFHCQQCVEKYLKAFLTMHQRPFPKTHDLIALKKLCLGVDGTFELIHSWLESLEGYDVQVRYPGETATAEDAREALAAMQKVRQFMQGRLGSLL